MKKVLAVAMIAILAASTVFAAFTGSAKVSLGYDFDSTEYGFKNTPEVDFDWEISTLNGEKVGEGDVYASIKGSLKLTVDDGKDDDPVAPGDEFVNELAVKASIDEAKIASADWYVSILGQKFGFDLAKSAIDTYGDDDEAVTVKLDAKKYNDKDIPGVEVGAFGYVGGFGLVGNVDADKMGVIGYAKTPEYKFVEDALTVQAAAGAQRVSGAGADVATSVSVGYVADAFSVKAASDFLLSAVKNGEKAEFTPNVDVALNVAVAPVTLDVYYGYDTTDTANIPNLLSAKVVTDLNAFEIPVTVTATGKNLVNTQDLKLEVGATVDKIAGKVYGGYVVADKKWSAGAEASYTFDTVGKVYAGCDFDGVNDLATAKAKVGIENTTLIEGATLKAEYAATNFVTEEFGEITASCKLAF